MTGDGSSDVIAKTESFVGTEHNCHESRSKCKKHRDFKSKSDPAYLDRYLMKKKRKHKGQDASAGVESAIEDSLFLPLSVPVIPDLNAMAGALESHVICNEGTSSYLDSKLEDLRRKKKKSKRRERRERKIGHCFPDICHDDQTFQTSIVPEIAELNDIFERIAEAVDPLSIQKLESCIPFEPEFFGSELQESSKRRKRAKHSRKEKIKAKHISSQPVIPISDDGSCIQIPTEASILQSNDVLMQNCDAVQAVPHGVMELNIDDPSTEGMQLELLEFPDEKKKSATCNLNKKTDKGIEDTVVAGADISVNEAWTEDLVNQIGSSVLDPQLNEFTNHESVVSLVSTVQNDSSILHDFNTMIDEAAVPESFKKKRRDKKSRKERRKEKYRFSRTSTDESIVPPLEDLIPSHIIASATTEFNDVGTSEIIESISTSLTEYPVLYEPSPLALDSDPRLRKTAILSRKEKHEYQNNVTDPVINNDSINQIETEAMLEQSLPRIPLTNDDILLMPEMVDLTDNSQIESSLGLNSELLDIAQPEDSLFKKRRKPEENVYEFAPELVDLTDPSQIVSPLEMGTQLTNSAHQMSTMKRKRKSLDNSEAEYTPTHDETVHDLNDTQATFPFDYMKFESPARLSTESLTTKHHALLLRRPGRIPQTSKTNVPVHTPESDNLIGEPAIESAWEDDVFYNTNHQASCRRKGRTSHFTKTDLPEVIDPANRHMELSEISTEVLINKLKRTLARKRRKAMSEQTPEYTRDYMDDADFQLESNSEPITSLETSTELLNFQYQLACIKRNQEQLDASSMNELASTPTTLDFADNSLTESSTKVTTDRLNAKRQNSAERRSERIAQIMKAEVPESTTEAVNSLNLMQSDCLPEANSDLVSKRHSVRRTGRPFYASNLSASTLSPEMDESLNNVQNEPLMEPDTELPSMEHQTCVRRIGSASNFAYAEDVPTLGTVESVNNTQNVVCHPQSAADAAFSSMIRRSSLLKRTERTSQVATDMATPEIAESINNMQNDTPTEMRTEYKSTKSRSSGKRLTLHISKIKVPETASKTANNERFSRTRARRQSSPRSTLSLITKRIDVPSRTTDQDDSMENNSPFKKGADHLCMRYRSLRRTGRIFRIGNTNVNGIRKVGSISVQNEHMPDTTSELLDTKYPSRKRISRISKVAKPCDVNLSVPPQEWVNLGNIAQKEYTSEARSENPNTTQRHSLLRNVRKLVHTRKIDAPVSSVNPIETSVVQSRSSLSEIGRAFKTVDAVNNAQNESLIATSTEILNAKYPHSSLRRSTRASNIAKGNISEIVGPANGPHESQLGASSELSSQSDISSECLSTKRRSSPPRRYGYTSCIAKNTNLHLCAHEIINFVNSAQNELSFENGVEMSSACQTTTLRIERSSRLKSAVLTPTTGEVDAQINAQNEPIFERNNELFNIKRQSSPKRIAKTFADISASADEAAETANVMQTTCPPDVDTEFSNMNRRFSLRKSVMMPQFNTNTAISSSEIINSLFNAYIEPDPNIELANTKLSSSPSRKMNSTLQVNLTDSLSQIFEGSDEANRSPSPIKRSGRASRISKTHFSADNNVQNKSSFATTTELLSTKCSSLSPKLTERISHIAQNYSIDKHVYTPKVVDPINKTHAESATEKKTDVYCAKCQSFSPRLVGRVPEVVKTCDVDVPVSAPKTIDSVRNAQVKCASECRPEFFSNKRQPSPRRLRNMFEIAKTYVDDASVSTTGDDASTESQIQDRIKMLSSTRPSSALRNIRKKSEAIKTMLSENTTEAKSRVDNVQKSSISGITSCLRRIRKIPQDSTINLCDSQTEIVDRMNNDGQGETTSEIIPNILNGQVPRPPSSLRTIRKTRNRKTSTSDQSPDNFDPVNEKQQDATSKLESDSLNGHQNSLNRVQEISHVTNAVNGHSFSESVNEAQRNAPVKSVAVVLGVARRPSLRRVEQTLDDLKIDELIPNKLDSNSVQDDFSLDVAAKLLDTRLSSPKRLGRISQITNVSAVETVHSNENSQTKSPLDDDTQVLISKRRSSLRSMANTPQESDVRTADMVDLVKNAHHEPFIRKSARRHSTSPKRSEITAEVPKRRKSVAIDPVSNVENEYPRLKICQYQSSSPRRMGWTSETMDVFKPVKRIIDSVGNVRRESPSKMITRNKSSSPRRIGRLSETMKIGGSVPDVGNVDSASHERNESRSKMKTRHQSFSPRRSEKSADTTKPDDSIFAGEIDNSSSNESPSIMKTRLQSVSPKRKGKPQESYGQISAREIIDLIRYAGNECAIKMNTRQQFPSKRTSRMSSKTEKIDDAVSNNEMNVSVDHVRCESPSKMKRRQQFSSPKKLGRDSEPIKMDSSVISDENNDLTSHEPRWPEKSDITRSNELVFDEQVVDSFSNVRIEYPTKMKTRSQSLSPRRSGIALEVAEMNGSLPNVGIYGSGNNLRSKFPSKLKTTHQYPSPRKSEKTIEDAKSEFFLSELGTELPVDNVRSESQSEMNPKLQSSSCKNKLQITDVSTVHVPLWRYKSINQNPEMNITDSPRLKQSSQVMDADECLPLPEARNADDPERREALKPTTTELSDIKPGKKRKRRMTLDTESKKRKVTSSPPQTINEKQTSKEKILESDDIGKMKSAVTSESNTSVSTIKPSDIPSRPRRNKPNHKYLNSSFYVENCTFAQALSRAVIQNVHGLSNNSNGTAKRSTRASSPEPRRTLSRSMKCKSTKSQIHIPKNVDTLCTVKLNRLSASALIAALDWRERKDFKCPNCRQTYKRQEFLDY